MNRVYTITLTDGPSVPRVTAIAAALTEQGMQVQDQGGQTIGFRVSGATPEERDAVALLHATDAMESQGRHWVLATGLGVHRREVLTAGAVL